MSDIKPAEKPAAATAESIEAAAAALEQGMADMPELGGRRNGNGSHLLSQGTREREIREIPPRDERRPSFSGGSEDTRLTATTRVVNAFLGYVTQVGGRQSDQMINADVAKLRQLLGIMDDVQPTNGGNGSSRFRQQ